jgi:hypothetical protein
MERISASALQRILFVLPVALFVVVIGVPSVRDEAVVGVCQSSGSLYAQLIRFSEVVEGIRSDNGWVTGHVLVWLLKGLTWVAGDSP